MKLDGAVAVVIGGASGMGKCYCEYLLQAGTKVLNCDIQEALGRETTAELSDRFGAANVAFRKCNGCSEDDIRASLEEARRLWGRLDIIVNHVGIVNETNWRRMVDINISSAVITCQLAEELMGKNHGGSGGVLVHTASRAGVIPSHFMPIYAGTKAAVVQLTRAMMHPSHYRRHGVRMMCVCPGITKTPMVADVTKETMGHLHEQIKAALKMKDETNSWVQPEWVAELLIHLLENDEEMAGVAAEINSRTPVYHYKGEWKDVK